MLCLVDIPGIPALSFIKGNGRGMNLGERQGVGRGLERVEGEATVITM